MLARSGAGRIQEGMGFTFDGQVVLIDVFLAFVGAVARDAGQIQPGCFCVMKHGFKGAGGGNAHIISQIVADVSKGNVYRRQIGRNKIFG